MPFKAISLTAFVKTWPVTFTRYLMPRNGSGVYGPPAGTAAVPNTPIESAKYNAFVNDISEAMTNSINVNGTAPFQAHQPMGGFKHTNLGAGSAAGDSVNLAQAQSNIIAHAAS